MSSFSLADAMNLARKNHYDGNIREFWMGLNVEWEHRSVVKGSKNAVAKIVLNHLDERKDYYSFGLRKGLFSRKEVGL